MVGKAKRANSTRHGDGVAELRKENAKLKKQLNQRTAALNDALEQQTATAEVLQVINSSSGDLAPVFDAMLERALRLCEADIGTLWTYDGEFMHPTAFRCPSRRLADFWQKGGPFRPARPQQPLLQGQRFVQVADLSATEGYRDGDPLPRAVVDLGGVRSLLNVALQKDKILLGLFAIYRKEVRPFTSKQIALVQNFADQAVIAIENARLITETREALDQQTATAEVLGVINSSPGDLTPVFEAMLEKAMQLCEATFGGLTAFDGERFHTLASRGLPADAVAAFREPWIAGPGSYHDNLVRGEPLVHTDFGVTDPARRSHPQSRAIMEIGKARTGLIIALRKDERLLGSLFFYRQEVRPFSDKQIALLQNFGAQAVIAMENARLITETREALEQQTATAEVLGVINSSPGDLAQVFEMMLDKATRLCRAGFGSLWSYEGERFRVAAVHALPTALAEFVEEPVSIADSASLAEIVRGQSVVHVADLAASELYDAGNPVRRAYVELGGARTLLSVALRKDNTLLGAFNIYRQEVRPFSDKQIALVQNLAAQAVIAMENARLITETREALEQQTATAEVLGVINSSPGDLAPVFDAMVERAARLCEADEAALRTFDGELLHVVAVHGSEPDVVARLRQLGPTRAYGLYEPFARGERVVHIPDVRTTDIFRDDPVVRQRLELRGIRTWLAVALHNEGILLGVILVHRHTVRPFTQKQIALLQNFAAQAVIAIENARLITETREALEQQTATSEVLQVINSSPDNLGPVFDAMLDRATRLSEASFGILWTYEDQCFQAVSFRNVPRAYAEFLRQPVKPEPLTAIGRIAQGEAVAHIRDIAADEYYEAGGELVRQGLSLSGFRTVLAVSMRKNDRLLGAITIYRQEPLLFSDKQIALLQNFADQAVIAMENARLITETREALEQQTATAEVLQVINASPGDLAPVFDAILEKAHSLCGAPSGSLQLYDGHYFRAVATRGMPEPFAALLRQGYRPLTTNARLLGGDSFVQVADMAEIAARMPGDRLARATVEVAGIRTLLRVALRKDGALLGTIIAGRHEVRPFSDKQIALLQNFAAQAVIAMENARLITETHEALDQQTATAEVLGVINASPGDLAPVFDAMLERALRLCGATYGHLVEFDGDLFHTRALSGDPRVVSLFRQLGSFRPPPGSVAERLTMGEQIVHLLDAARDDENRDDSPLLRQLREIGGMRSLLGVALRKDDSLIGGIIVYRKDVRPFSDKQIALLQNFAAQAVIAMENARLITETRDALEQQTATAEVLQVINSSPGDLTPVFDAMLEKATRLCSASFGILLNYDGQRFRHAALRGIPPAYAKFMQEHPPIYGPDSAPGRLLAGEDLVHVLDMMDTDLYRSGEPNRQAIADLAGARTVVGVPLRKDDVLMGAIVVFRQEVRAFSEKELSLLQNFAAQAVIAMENARLITETREALEQQTATAEVLQVINSSPGELTPVFQTMLDLGVRLCEARYGLLGMYDGDGFRGVASFGFPPEAAEGLSRVRHPPPGTTLALAQATKRTVQIADISVEPSFAQVFQANPSLRNARTNLVVPMLKEGDLAGAILVFRDVVRPFTEKQIALLQNFASQAVIAIENARLITETREALEQQTATAEVLGVINSSPGDLAPVFDAMLEKAMRLCEAAFGGLTSYDGERFHTLATRGLRPELVEVFREPWIPGAGSFHDGLVHGQSVMHGDHMENPALGSGHAQTHGVVELGGARTGLVIALQKDRRLLGSFWFYRTEARPFSDKQIALLQNFAAQAVIAMENARLLDEIRQRQAELRVTFDNMGDGVVMFDDDLRLAAWNRNFQEMLDLPDNILADRPRYADYLRLLAGRGEFGTEDIETELRRRLENTEQEYRTERSRPDGRVIEVRRNAVPDGGFVLIYSDITERKRSEAEIRAARDAAEAAYRDLKAAQASLVQAEKMASLGQLTAGIAHEIKNPLNFVNNFAGLSVELLDELKEATAPAMATLDEDKRAEVGETVDLLTSNLERIAEHGRRADGIVKSMLEHSRGGMGERRSIDLNSLVEEALNLAYHGGRAQDQSFNITLERDYARNLAPIELVPQDITRVCLNLFGNGFYAATKRQKEGADPKFKPTLKVMTRDLGDEVEIRARDNGVGIPPEMKDKLFQPFFTTKPTGEGTGLGLSISYDIVTQQHGGTIEIDSQVGEFTEFTVRLPRAPGPRVAA